MLSMSIASRSALDAPKLWLWITPSTTISGELLLLMEVGERSRMFVPLPGWPEGMTVTPDILPWIDSSALVAGTGRFAASTRPTVKGTRVPLVGSTTPVETIASRLRTAAFSLMSTVTVPPAGTDTSRTTRGWKPMRRASIACVPAGTFTSM
jgi:hypothetical protein